MAYAVLPCESTQIISYVHSFPFSAIIAAKVAVGLPTFYHSYNGVRHLIWDAGSALTIKGVYVTGYAVIALSLVSTFAFAMFV